MLRRCALNPGRLRPIARRRPAGAAGTPPAMTTLLLWLPSLLLRHLPARVRQGRRGGLRCVLAALLLCLGSAAAHALPALVLDDAQPSVKAWPAITVLTDPGGRLTLDDLRPRLHDFLVPSGPEGNLGRQADPVWLHLPVQVAQGDGRWVLDIDYPLLKRIDVYVLRAGRTVTHAVLGSGLPFDQRPMRTRSHALALALEPGQSYELLLRVATSSAMVLPIHLSKADDFHARESGEQWLQGAFSGIWLALLIYSLLHWLSLRDATFLYYALSLAGLATFFLLFFGIGHQHLWNHQTDTLTKLSPMSVLMAVASGCQFVALSLDLRTRQRRLWLALQATSAAAAVAFLASATDLLDYRGTQFLASLLSPLPMLLVIPSAYVQARAGDRVALFMLLGWSSYMAGALALTALLRGYLPASPLAQHLLQIAVLAEMLFWTRVLSLRIEGIRRDAERATQERLALLSLANTDALTGLPNRRGLHLALDGALRNCRPDNLVAVYLLDLDGFKPINDRWGHDVGDTLLVRVGQRLCAQLRRSDVVARLGGDEFVIMSEGIGGEAEALALGRKVLEAFGQAFEVQGQECQVGLTIGFALAPHDGVLAADLLKRADAAMYAGKQRDRNCIQRGGASMATGGH